MRLTIQPRIQTSVALYGGSGHDFLIGSVNADILEGGEGNDIIFGGLAVDDAGDLLSGGSGRDILCGGAGMDFLRGGLDEEILVTGLVDTSRPTWPGFGIRIEWTSSHTYTERVTNISRAGSGGFNGLEHLTSGSTVLDDDQIDLVLGEEGQDWLFADASEDLVGDLEADELLSNIEVLGVWRTA